MRTDQCEYQREVSPLDVCQRLPLLDCSEARSLAWFLHSLSSEGLNRATRDLVEAFPERLITDHMRKIGKPPGGFYSQDDALRILGEIGDARVMFWDDDSIDGIEAVARISASERTPEHMKTLCRGMAIERLPGLLREFCGSCGWCLPGGEEFARATAASKGIQVPIRSLDVVWFQDLAGTILEYKRQQEAAVASDFYRTNIGRAVWGGLDSCLARRNGGVIQGETGRGKSAAVRAWCDAHRGEARLVSLTGHTDKHSVYREFAKSLGLGITCSRRSFELKDRVIDVLKRGELMLVIDEAHFLVPQVAPNRDLEFINFLCAGVRQQGVPVVLVSTPQFASRLAEFETVCGWNARQFRRRFSGVWCNLDSSTNEEDLAALAARSLPAAGRRGVKLAVGYALGFRDVSGLFDLVQSARFRAKVSGRDEPTFEDVLAAFKLDRKPADEAMSAAFSQGGRASSSARNPGRRIISRAEPAEAANPPCATSEAPVQVPRSRDVGTVLADRSGAVNAPMMG